MLSQRGLPSSELFGDAGTDPFVRPFSDFGVLGAGNDTATIQAAINWCATANGTDGTGRNKVGQGGSFRVDGVIWKHGARMVCPGPTATLFRPVLTPSTPALFLLDSGPVQRTAFEGFSINMAGSSQHAFYLKANPILVDGVVQGGLWHSEFKNIHITGGTGEGIWLHAGGDALNGPHQFLKFSQVHIVSSSTSRSALRMSGQCGQIGFDASCIFDGTSRTNTGQNILLQRTVDASEVTNGDIMPYSIDFNGATCQTRKRLVTVERGLAINCRMHYEEAEEGVHVDISSGLTSVKDSYFGNVGHNAGGTGFAVRVDSGNLVVGDNYFAGSCDLHYARRFGGTITTRGGDIDSNGIKYGTGTNSITVPAMTAAATLVTGNANYVFVNTSATAITDITSDLPPGATLILRANGGTIRLGQSANIDLGQSGSPLIVESGVAITLARNTLSGKWQVVAMSGSRGAYHRSPVFVNFAMSPYSVPDDVDDVRVDCSAGIVEVRLTSRATAVAGREISVKKLDSSVNELRVNGQTVGENPDGQGTNVVKMTQVNQTMTFRRNDVVSAGGWDLVGGISAPTGVLGGAGSTLTFGTHLTGTSYNGSAPVTIGTDATTSSIANTIVARGASGQFTAGVITVSTTGSVRGIDIADAAGNTGISFQPANSGSSAFVDVTRVGSQLQFRVSAVAVTDRTWLSVSSAGVATFAFGAVFSANTTFSSTAVFNNQVQFNSTIATNLLPTSSGTLDLGGGINKWRDYYATGRIEIGSYILTGAPAGGTAAAWKLGTVVSTSGLTLDTTRYIQLDVSGTLWKVGLVF